ncbi:MAG: replication-associated recombination protein A [Candidatus Kapaibacteriota bacterium]
MATTTVSMTPPLADRMRPTTINQVVGQEHLLGQGGPIQRFIEQGALPSMILWGPPGTGKTTIAQAICASAGIKMERLSAIESGVKDLRAVIERAAAVPLDPRKTVVFIDEIHRFTKSQQDALLHAVERGVITLIGATTENPSFEVNAALLSRCHVYRLQSLTDDHLREIVERACNTDTVLSAMHVVVDDWSVLLQLSGGDARSALNALETAASIAEPDQNSERHLTAEVLQRAVQRKLARYDRAGESHYDTASALIKSMRGSDPNAALLYLAIMIDAGEDPLFIARRLIIFASEDIGNADPRALPLATATFQAIERIGMPEGRIPLAQCVTFLASAPKSNASYVGIGAALEAVQRTGTTTIPLHLRNAPTQLMKSEGYGKDYMYPHNAPGHFVPGAEYFPPEVPPISFYQPDGQGAEAAVLERLRQWWPERYR